MSRKHHEQGQRDDKSVEYHNKLLEGNTRLWSVQMEWLYSVTPASIINILGNLGITGKK